MCHVAFKGPRNLSREHRSEIRDGDTITRFIFYYGNYVNYLMVLLEVFVDPTPLLPTEKGVFFKTTFVLY